jgi:hypothetical protein
MPRVGFEPKTPVFERAKTIRALTLSVHVAVWIRETVSGPPTHVRVNSEPSQARPSPACGAPHTDGFGSLEPEPSQTHTCMGTRPRGRCERRGILLEGQIRLSIFESTV